MHKNGWLIVLASTGFMLATGTASLAQKNLFSNEKVTLACQQYVNALYPAGQGSMDREREGVFRACLRRKGK